MKLGEALTKQYPLHPDDEIAACCLGCGRERSGHDLKQWDHCWCALPAPPWKGSWVAPVLTRAERREDYALYERLERHDKWKD